MICYVSEKISRSDAPNQTHNQQQHNAMHYESVHFRLHTNTAATKRSRACHNAIPRTPGNLGEIAAHATKQTWNSKMNAKCKTATLHRATQTNTANNAKHKQRDLLVVSWEMKTLLSLTGWRET